MKQGRGAKQYGMQAYGGQRGKRHWNKGAGTKLKQEQFNGQKNGGKRRAENGGHPRGRSRREQRFAFMGGYMNKLS